MVCEVCDLIKTKKNIIYEDNLAVALLLHNATSPGHIKVVSKSHKTISDMDEGEFSQLYTLSSIASSMIFELLKLDGTNMISTNFNDGHFSIDIVPRKKDDGLDFSWTPNEMSQQDLDDSASKLRDAMPVSGVEEKPAEVLDLDKEKRIEPIGKESDENYLIKQLKRIP